MTLTSWHNIYPKLAKRGDSVDRDTGHVDYLGHDADRVDRDGASPLVAVRAM